MEDDYISTEKYHDLLRENEILIALVNAVVVSGIHIVCSDVFGKNWFDVRDEITKEI